MKLASILLLIIGGLLLLFYPFVMMSDFMLLSGMTTSSRPFGELTVSYGLIITTSVYPLVYGVCLYFVIVRLKRKKHKRALSFSICPIGYIAVIVALFEIGRIFGLT